MAFDFNRMAGQALANPLGTLGTNLIAFNPAVAALTGGQSVAKPLQKLAGNVAGPAATYQLVQQPGAMPQVAAVPENVTKLAKPFSMQDLMDPNKGLLTTRVQQALLADQTRAEAVKTGYAMLPLMEQAKKSELERMMAAAQIRSNIGTNQALTLGGAQTAQQMGLNAASQMGSALAAQYQYG
jgi:hypothetical protein